MQTLRNVTSVVIPLTILIVGGSLLFSAKNRVNINSNPTPLSFLVPTLVPKTTSPPSGILSPSYILLDSSTNQILLNQNSHQKIFPASTTKIATALTALNLYPLDEVVTITTNYTSGKVMGTQIGEQYKVSELLKALLVYSANDAAIALASHHPNGIAGFLSEMKNYFATNNIFETNFVNPDGVDNSSHTSTVYDLAQLARLAVKDPIIRQDVLNKEVEVTDLSGKKKLKLTSTNELLDKYPEIVGLKTGWTPEANGNFVGVIKYKDRLFISVVGKTDDRFGDTVKILNWLKANY